MTSSREARTAFEQAVKWLTDLTDLCALTGERKVTKALIGAYATTLLETVPPAAFSRSSLVSVAPKFAWFPSVGPLQEALMAWWEINAPRNATAYADPDIQHLPLDVRLWVIRWRIREAEVAQHPGASQDQIERTLANLRSLIEDRSPAAAAFISGKPDASSAEGWAKRARDLEAEWGEVPTVKRALATLEHAGWPPGEFRRLRSLLTSWAPQHLPMLDAQEAWLREQGQPVVAERVPPATPAPPAAIAAPSPVLAPTIDAYAHLDEEVGSFV